MGAFLPAKTVFPLVNRYYGLGMAKRKLTESTFYHCKKRAEEIAEEQNGRLD